MALSHRSTIDTLSPADKNQMTFFERIQTMQPWELVQYLEAEKLDVNGNMQQLQARLMYRHMQTAYPMISKQTWLEYLQLLEQEIRSENPEEQKENVVQNLTEATQNLTLESREYQPEREELFKALQRCKLVLKDLFSKEFSNFSWIFYKPVNTELLGLSDFHDVITKPMDLCTIKEKMDKSMYKTPVEFYDDVHLMINNFYKYFKPDHEFYAMAKKFEANFEIKYANIRNEDMPNTDTSDDDSSSSEDDITIGSEEEEMKPRRATSYQKLKTQLESMQTNMEKVLAKVQLLEDELAQNKKRMESLEAAAEKQSKKLEEMESNRLEEDELSYRLRCVKLIKSWDWNDLNEAWLQKGHEDFLENLNDFRNYSKISDRVLFELLPYIAPGYHKDWCRKNKFNTWESFVEAFKTRVWQNYVAFGK